MSYCLFRLRASVLAWCFSLAASLTAVAGAPSAADLSALKNFKLSSSFLEKYEAYEEQAAEDPCNLSPLFALQSDDDDTRTLDQTVAAFDARPGVHAALAQHGLNARELILGMTAMIGAAAHDMAQKHPEMVETGKNSANALVSPENLAFYRAHKDEFHRHQAQLGRESLKRNGGHLPACFTDKSN